METTEPLPATPPPMNEFQRIYNEGLDEIPRVFDQFTEKYPLIATVCMVVFMVLGISSILSFSITAIVSGTALAALSLALGKNIFSDPAKFWERLQPALTALFTCSAKEGAETTTDDDDNSRAEVETPR
jgi:hypothetical protein